jgi:two-component system, chemotaxis family, response regulator Rcp1
LGDLFEGSGGSKQDLSGLGLTRGAQFAVEHSGHRRISHALHPKQIGAEGGTSGKKPIEVLLVEDNAGDSLLISEILADAPIPITLHIAPDGMEALLMLSGRVSHPDLVILDLNIPGISGQVVLGHYHPRDVPVVVFTSLCSEADARRSLDAGAREVVQKPTHVEDYRSVVLGMIEKWAVHK